MDEEIKKLLEENLELTKDIHEMTKKIKSYITFQKIMSLIYLLVILVPIVLGAIYLPPLVKNIYNQYQSILGITPSGGFDQLFNEEGIKKYLEQKAR